VSYKREEKGALNIEKPNSLWKNHIPGGWKGYSWESRGGRRGAELDLKRGRTFGKSTAFIPTEKSGTISTKKYEEKNKMRWCPRTGGRGMNRAVSRTQTRRRRGGVETKRYSQNS